MSESAAHELGGLRVLAVDDHEINRRFLRAVLRNHVATLELAGSGHEAIDRATTGHFDMILMDLHMPDMDGSQAWARIGAALDPGKRPRIIALTADSRPEERQRLKAAGFDGFLAKPVETDVLVESMQRVASGKKVFDPPDAAMDNGACLLDQDRAQRVSGGVKHATRMQAAMAEELARQRTELDTMLAEARFDAAVALLHQWRGACGYCGANRLERACARLEQALADGGDSAPGLLYLDLVRTVDSTIQAIGHRSTRAPTA